MPVVGPCGGQTCSAGQVCRFNACVATPAACNTDSQCQGDSYCQASECIPYGVGPRGSSNAQCKRITTMGVFSPKIKCRWSGPAAGDPYPNHKTVLSSPVVVDFDLDKDPQKIKPSIVFTSGNCAKSCQSEGGGCYGVVRVIDGDTCQPQFSLSAPAGALIIEQTPPSVADLNGDKRPEIVVQNQAGGITAFTFDPALNSGKGDFKSLFHNASAVNPTGCTWAALSIHDLTNDGVPEIIQASPNPVVYSNTGALIDKSAVVTDGLPATSQLQPVLADIDGDGQVELLTGKEVLRFNAASRKWELVSSNGPRQGFVGLADFGTYTANGNDRSKLDGVPEIVLVTVDGRVRVLRADGTVILNVAHPGTAGGSPTIADFDKDGRVEIGVAGATRYTVFDPDCIAGGTAATCPTGRTDNTLWSQVTQDPSGFTGSTVFDFDGDGRPKVVYADECFLRIYDGANGEVLSSLPSRSQTYYEAPVVADSNGDAQAEIVVAQNSAAGCPAVDPTFAGPRCATTSDCPGTATCVRQNANDAYGRCSCTTDAQCQSADQPFLSCQPALAGAGRVCRTARDQAQTSEGVVVIADTRGRWVPTRPLWNQFVYTVTNVNDDTSIPKTSEWLANWKQAGLNNFLQNVQGQLNLQGAPDLTVRPEALRACVNNKLILAAQVCNRGTLPTGVSLPVVFSDGATALCTATTSGSLAVGACQRVSCDATLSGNARDLTLVVQAMGVNECEAGNNRATLTQAGCYQCTAADASACTGAGQICDLAQRRCAPCASDGQCGAGQVCRTGTCQAGASECSAVDASACVSKGLVCDAASGRCTFCSSDSQCAAGLVCDRSCGGVCLTPGIKNPRFVGGCSAAAGSGTAGGLGLGAGALLLLAALRRRRQGRRGLAAAAVLALLGVSGLTGVAHAQDNTPRVNAQNFKPVLMPEGLITVEGSRTPRALRPILGFLLEYAYRPLRLVDGDGVLVANTIPRMLTAHLYAGFGVTRWLALAASLPVVAYQDYDSRTPKSLIPEAPSTTGLGDLRLLAKLRILNNEEGGFGLAFAPQVTFPTGGIFRSDDAYGIEPRFAADWRSKGGFLVAANVGFLARTSDQELLNAKISHQVRYGGGVYLPFGLGLGLAAEVSGGTSVKKGQSLYSQLEAYGALRWVGKNGINFNMGGGAAVIESVGSPLFRVFAGLGYLPMGAGPAAPLPPVDRDGDGIIDSEDQCPDQAEDKDGFQDQDGCPDPDNDGDGVLDVEDACPLVAGLRENRGCPDQDRDGDGIIDRQDKCPEQPGPSVTQGCPDPDQDGDGLVDRLDKCPDKAGPKENQGCPDTDQDEDGVVDRSDLCPTEKGPAPTGCPKKKFIEVTADKINLREQVRFDSDKAIIKPGSYPMLDEVVKVLKGRPDLLLRIEGHTDSSGKLERNMVLSEQRAAAVLDYLVKGGVDAGHMVSKGYGPTKPIADNATKAGREKNRRTDLFLVTKEEFEAAKAK